MMTDLSHWIDEPVSEDSRPIVRRRRIQEELGLDITPMIDMTFLLLIFFLVASTPDDQARIYLPEARHGEGVSAHSSVFFTIAQGGFNTAAVYQSESKKADQLLPDDPQQQNNSIEDAVAAAVGEGRINVVIKAEKGVPYREVARVAAAASRIDGIRLYLAVLEAD